MNPWAIAATLAIWTFIIAITPRLVSLATQ